VLVCDSDSVDTYDTVYSILSDTELFDRSKSKRVRARVRVRMREKIKF